MVQKNGLEDYYVIRNQKKLRFGYTTGSCAAGAARGAVRLLLGEDEISEVELMTPKGILLHLEILDRKRSENAASCAVRKDAGDDPDTTNGILVYAKVEKFLIRSDMEDRIVIDGGIGVGRVTKPGLSQKVGEAAINPVPRAMILQAVEEIADQYHYEGGLKVTISVPEGEKIARKTFNPRLGIVGGISILGTSGIVEPMSEKALIDSIRVEMTQHAAMGEQYMLVTPGNYGADYLRIMGVGQIFMCVELMTVGALSGMGKTMEASVITIILTASRIPLAVILGGTAMGLNGIWWALTISSIVKGIIFFVYYLHIMKRMKA